MKNKNVKLLKHLGQISHLEFKRKYEKKTNKINNSQLSMLTPPEPSYLTTASREYSKTAETQEKEPKTNFMKKWINPLKNLRKKTNKNLEETNESYKESQEKKQTNSWRKCLTLPGWPGTEGWKDWSPRVELNTDQTKTKIKKWSLFMFCHTCKFVPTPAIIGEAAPCS